MSRAAEIAAALEATRSRITDAARAAGRGADSVRLIAVSKKMPIEDLRAARTAGQRDFGENYAQELRDKREAFSAETGGGGGDDLESELRWHFIGPLQSNKLKILVGRVALIHSVDSAELVEQIDRRMAATPSATDGPPALQPASPSPTQACLVQVNLAGPGRRSGVEPEGLAALLDAFAAFPRVACVGLMLIPPQTADPDMARRHFATLRTLAEQQRRIARPNVDLRELSMGMSHDFPLAVSEGATMVRVGTAIFGARPS